MLWLMIRRNSPRPSAVSSSRTATGPIGLMIVFLVVDADGVETSKHKFGSEACVACACFDAYEVCNWNALEHD